MKSEETGNQQINRIVFNRIKRNMTHKSHIDLFITLLTLTGLLCGCEASPGSAKDDFNSKPEIVVDSQTGMECAMYTIDPDPAGYKVYGNDGYGTPDTNCFVFRAAAEEYFVEANFDRFSGSEKESCHWPNLGADVHDGNNTMANTLNYGQCGESTHQFRFTSSGPYMTFRFYNRDTIRNTLDDLSFRSMKRCTPVYAADQYRELPALSAAHALHSWYLECYTIVADPGKQLVMNFNGGSPYYLFVNDGLNSDTENRLMLIGDNYGMHYENPLRTKGSIAYVLVYYDNVQETDTTFGFSYQTKNPGLSGWMTSLIVLCSLMVPLLLVLIGVVACRKRQPKPSSSDAPRTNAAPAPVVNTVTAVYPTQPAYQPLTQPAYQPVPQPAYQPMQQVSAAAPPAYHTVMNGQQPTAPLPAQVGPTPTFQPPAISGDPDKQAAQM